MYRKSWLNGRIQFEIFDVKNKRYENFTFKDVPRNLWSEKCWCEQHGIIVIGAICSEKCSKHKNIYIASNKFCEIIANQTIHTTSPGLCGFSIRKTSACEQSGY